MCVRTVQNSQVFEVFDSYTLLFVDCIDMRDHQVRAKYAKQTTERNNVKHCQYICTVPLSTANAYKVYAAMDVHRDMRIFCTTHLVTWKQLPVVVHNLIDIKG